ncbi:MAG: hypothetical protein ABI453_18225, partial [Isosphaeraceae bacterium]
MLMLRADRSQLPKWQSRWLDGSVSKKFLAHASGFKARRVSEGHLSAHRAESLAHASGFEARSVSEGHLSAHRAERTQLPIWQSVAKTCRA